MSDLSKLIKFFPKPGNSFGSIEEKDGGVKVNLNKDGSSWIEILTLPEIPGEDVFEEFWSFRPEKLGKIAMGTVPRYQQSYGKGYRFSGIDHKPKPAPDIVQKYLDWANGTSYATMYHTTGFNQSFVNWYENGEHYIGPHSDDESQIQLSPEGETTIVSLNFQEGPVNRIFRIKPKGKGKGLGKERLDIEMPNGIALVMGGRMQSTHTHQVPKATKARKHVGRRVNLTFRQFE